MVKKEQILERIPRFSTGRVRNDDLLEIERLLTNYKFSEEELVFFEKQVEAWVKRYGYDGVFVTKGRRDKPTRINWI